MVSMTDGSDPRAQKRVGAVLDEKWTLEVLIGSGGMGAVYSARHRNGARAAVKILHPELARLSDVRERFLREGYAANRVEHRGVVQVLDDDIVTTGDDEGSAYLVMELLEGESLQDRVMRGPKLTERELLEVMDAVVDVLAAAHAHGVVHRDLKPENIFLARDPEREGVRVKVLDFGLARLAEASGVTNAGMAVGTPSFMSPEQAAGRSADIDGRTDIFALGATVFRIVTGRRIHDAENMVQLVVLMATNAAPPLRTIAPSVSESFANVVDRALTFEREQRPDANALREIVHEALEYANPDDGGTLEFIPLSARSLRIGSSADIAQKTSDPAIRPLAKSYAGDREAPSTSDPPPSEDSRGRSGRPIAKSATLPWLLVLLLLAIGAWKLGPSLQEELVRRGSVWATAAPTTTTAPRASASASADPDPDPTSSATPAASNNATSDAGAALAIDDIERDAGDADEGDAGDPAAPVAEPAPSAPRDAGASHAVAARPHNDRPPTSHTTKPPVKKPPQPPQPPPRKRRH
jgi:eukaryotic-like serine/threonine-protein kinase